MKTQLNINTDQVHPRPSKDDQSFSEDVFIYTEDDLMNVGYFHFEDKKWRFHTDTLVDMDGVRFVWMYAPEPMVKMFQPANQV